MLAVVRLKQAQLMLDPGPKQNEISFIDLTMRLDAKDIGQDDALTEGQTDTAGPMTIVNIYAAMLPSISTGNCASWLMIY